MGHILLLGDLSGLLERYDTSPKCRVTPVKVSKVTTLPVEARSGGMPVLLRVGVMVAR